MIKRKLTDEERKRPYARFYDREPAAPSPALLKSCSRRLPPEQALKPEEVSALFEDRPENELVGWTVMENGSGYVACRIEMPGVTPEMMAWWFAWHPMESLRYMIWYPGRHFSAALSPEDLRNNLDPNVPILNKIAGVTHIVQEDPREDDSLTEVPPPIYISFRFPSEMGITAEQIGYPERGALVLASPPIAPDGTLPAKRNIMIHYTKAVPGGSVFYSRFWLGGYVLRNGKAEHVGVPVPTPDAAPRSLMLHCVREYTNLASFLPELYRETGGELSL